MHPPLLALRPDRARRRPRRALGCRGRDLRERHATRRRRPRDAATADRARRGVRARRSSRSRPTGPTYETAEQYGDRLADAARRLVRAARASSPTRRVDLSVFSPPFLSLYTYSPTERDLGNSRGPTPSSGSTSGTSMDELLRVTKPGRNVCRPRPAGADDRRPRRRDGAQATSAATSSGCFVDRGWRLPRRGRHRQGPAGAGDPHEVQGRCCSSRRSATARGSGRRWRTTSSCSASPARTPCRSARTRSTNEDVDRVGAPDLVRHPRVRDASTPPRRASERDEQHIAALQLETIRRCVRLWSNADETVLSTRSPASARGLRRRPAGAPLRRHRAEAQLLPRGRPQPASRRGQLELGLAG